MNKSFDRFATWAAARVAQAWFFLACIALVVVWLVLGPPMKWSDTHQLIINTSTTIITFLLVALLHNDQQRFEDRVDARLKELTDTISGAADPVDEEV